MSGPQLSVIVPVFNQITWLPGCLRSILDQPWGDFELLVVDDGSTDGSPDVVQAMARQDGRVRLLQQANAGAGAARNRGLQEACGTYLHFMDADDWLEPDAYAQWQQAARRYPQADVLLCNFNEASMATQHAVRVASYAVEDGQCLAGAFHDFPLTLIRGTVVPWNRWLRRHFVQGLGARFEELRFANDRAFNFRTLPHAREIVILGAALINYRTDNPQSLKGQAGVPRMRATVKAMQASMLAIRHLPKHLQLEAFALCLEDAVDLIMRALPQDRRTMVHLLNESLDGPWLPCRITSPLFQQRPWWHQWQSIQHASEDVDP